MNVYETMYIFVVANVYINLNNLSDSQLYEDALLISLAKFVVNRHLIDTLYCCENTNGGSDQQKTPIRPSHESFLRVLPEMEVV